VNDLVSQVGSQWDTLRSLAEPVSTLEGGTAQEGAVVCSTPKASCRRQNGTNDTIFSYLWWCCAYWSRDSKICLGLWLCQELMPLSVPGRAARREALLPYELCFPNLCGNPLPPRRGHIMAPSSRSPASWGSKGGNCSQGSDHRPVPLPNQNKEKPSGLVLSLPHSLAEKMASSQQQKPAFLRRHADGWKCCGQSLFFTVKDIHGSTMTVGGWQLQFHAWTGDLHTNSTTSAHAPHKPMLIRTETF